MSSISARAKAIAGFETDCIWKDIKSWPCFGPTVDALWRRVSAELYINSGELFTPNIDMAAGLLTIDVLAPYSECDAVAEHHWRVEQVVLHGHKYPQTRRIAQLVETMLLLSPVLTLEQGSQNRSIFVNIVNVLEHDEALSWDDVSRAISDLQANPKYLPVLGVLSAAMLEHESITEIVEALGAQWQHPTTRTLSRMQLVHVMLMKKCVQCRESIQEHEAEPEMLKYLWRRDQHSESLGLSAVVDSKKHITGCPETVDVVNDDQNAILRAVDAVPMGPQLLATVAWCIVEASRCWEQAPFWLETHLEDDCPLISTVAPTTWNGYASVAKACNYDVEDLKHTDFKYRQLEFQNKYEEAWHVFMLGVAMVVCSVWNVVPWG